MEEFRILPSQSLRKPLAYTNHPTRANKVYTWSNRGCYKNSEGDEMCYFACTGCRIMNDKDGTTRIPLRKANLTQKRWETNPKVPHSCAPLDQEDVAGMSLVRKIKKKVASDEVRLSGSQAAVRLSNTVATKFGNLSEERQQKIRKAAVGNESQLKQSIRRARIKRFPAKLKSFADLTEENYPELFKTFRAENAAEDSPLHNEKGVIYKGMFSKYDHMIILSSPRQLEWLSQTKVLISDGSFRYAPRDTYQVYRIFGFVADHHCVPLVTVQSDSKPRDTWVDNRLGTAFVSTLLTGPGTTNHAECYHSKLREHFPRSHPLLGEWFVIYRELSHYEEERAAAIERGDQQLRQGIAVYDDLKRRRLQQRASFDLFLDTDFTTQQFNSECYRYLGRMANLLGIGPENRHQRQEARSEEQARQRARAALHRLLGGRPAVSGPEDSSSDEEEQPDEGQSEEEDGGASDDSHAAQPDSDHDLFE